MEGQGNTAENIPLVLGLGYFFSPHRLSRGFLSRCYKARREMGPAHIFARSALSEFPRRFTRLEPRRTRRTFGEGGGRGNDACRKIERGKKRERIRERRKRVIRLGEK